MCGRKIAAKVRFFPLLKIFLKEFFTVLLILIENITPWAGLNEVAYLDTCFEADWLPFYSGKLIG